MSLIRRAFLALLPSAALLLIAAHEASVGRHYRASAALALAVAAAILAALGAWPRVRWLLPAVAPLLVAGLIGILDVPTRGTTAPPPPASDAAAAIPALVGFALLVLMAAGLDVDRGVAAVVRVVSQAMTAVVGSVLFVAVVLPGWAWTTIRRSDVLRPAAASPTTWHDRPASNLRAAAAAAEHRSLGADDGAPPARRSLTGRVTWAVGCVILLLGANYGVGWAWDKAMAKPSTGPASTTASRFTGKITRDPRIDSPAMAAYPWRTQYFADIQRTTGGYWPFTEFRPRDFTSPYVNIRGWLRQSYVAAGNPAAMPTVWMFGGSTTWGEGQRDDYTIASWVSRLAEKDGLPLRMANYGERGWTHFQEMILYEQQLAENPAPTFSIFYDGANEITTQSLINEPVPSHTLAYTYAQKLTGTSIATEFVQQPQPQNLLADVVRAYKQHSAIHKLVGLFRTQTAGAATASGTPTTGAPGGGFTPGQDQAANGGIYNYNMTPQDGIDAGRVYERGKLFTLMLSQRHHVQPFLFWQPVKFQGEPQQRALAQLTPSTIDISNVLDQHKDLYIDGGHTNEEGARLVAVAIWQHMKPAVQQWYRDHR